MDYEVRPNEGVGPLNFSMSRDEVASAIGKPKQTLAQEGDETGDLHEGGIAVYYDGEGKLQLVDFLRTSPTYDGDTLFDVDPEDWLEERDEEAEIDPPDYISEKLGISFFQTESGSKSVGVFRPGYYDYPDTPKEEEEVT